MGDGRKPCTPTLSTLRVSCLVSRVCYTVNYRLPTANWLLVQPTRHLMAGLNLFEGRHLLSTHLHHVRTARGEGAAANIIGWAGNHSLDRHQRLATFSAQHRHRIKQPNRVRMEW